jgi:hypothetical protein
MHRFSLSTSITALLVSLLLFAACGDDEEGEPAGDFQVTIVVTDAQGEPVAGLDLALVPDTPFYGEKKFVPQDPMPRSGQLEQPFPNPFYPAVWITAQLDAAGDLRLSIEDVEGTEQRLLDEQTAPAGPYDRQWNGQDDAGNNVPSGVYAARLMLRDPDSGDLVLDESKNMLLARMSAGSMDMSTTDADGKIELADRRLFPYLYGLDGIPAMDENGEQIGTIVLTPITRFYLSDPDGGTIMRFDREITGSTTLNFTWEPIP